MDENFAYQALAWIVFGGGAVTIASYALERIAWFQELTSEKRKWTFFGVAAVLAILAYAGIQYIPPAYLEAVAPYLEIIVAIGGAIGIGTVAHKTDLAAKPKG